MFFMVGDLVLASPKTFRSVKAAREEVRRRENASCTLGFTYIKNKMHTQRLESSTQSSVVEAIESDLQRQLCHVQLECKNYIEKHDEFRNESAPETHRLQDHESFPNV